MRKSAWFFKVHKQTSNKDGTKLIFLRIKHSDTANKNIIEYTDQHIQTTNK